MHRSIKTWLLCLLLCAVSCTGARALDNDMLKVGLRYGDEAMFSANLQNYNDAVAGMGYAMGYFDSGRVFVPLGPVTSEYKVTVTVDGTFYASGNACYPGAGDPGATVGGWHLQLAQGYGTYEEAAFAASRYEGAFVAFLANYYAVRVGQYVTQAEAESALAAWAGEDAAQTVGPSNTGVVVTVTGTNRVLFYFDCGGLYSLALAPQSLAGEKPVTWFRSYRYFGCFEYQRVTGGNMNVINVVNIEDYVKGSVPWEIGSDKPLEAIKAQAVCARTYAVMQTRHRSQGFDVCPTVDCQVYQGVAASNEISDRAVDETAGIYMYYDGKPAEAFYYSSNGGASEDAKNVWNEEVGYLRGKADPYEAYVAPRISKYNWSTTYTKSELSERLRTRGIDIGTVSRVYVSEFTPNGNVYSLTFVGSRGTKTVYRETCRTLLNLRSQRFRVGDADDDTYYINGTENSVSGIRGVYTVSGAGEVSLYGGAPSETWVVTSGGVAKLEREPAGQTQSDTFTFSGSGWGHNVGMSQWGATAMAELGYDFRAILEFYYTGVVIQ